MKFTVKRSTYVHYSRIVRNHISPDLGDIKIKYNGVPSDGKCNNSGENSTLTKEQMGTSSNKVAFNTNYTSPADVGYMNNTRYTSNSKNNMTSNQKILDIAIMSASTNYYYSNSYTWNGSSYVLDTPEQLTWEDNYQNIVGKYTCRNTSNTGICNSLSYVAGVESNKMYYLTLNNGRTIENETIAFSNSIDDNVDGTYTLSNPAIIKKIDWFTNFGKYNNYYTCGSSEITCNNNVIKYITTTYNSFMFYAVGYKSGNSFIWDGTNYTLVDTIDVINPTKSGALKNNHYTCFNSSGVCSELNYIYYLSSGIPYYVKLNNGKSIEDALNEMLYNEDVNTNDSTIKSAIDYWYQNNMTQYTDYLEDTVWCNDRSMDNKESNGWNPNGGNTSTLLYFKSNKNSSNLACQNKNDRYSVNKENGNGALRYPVGLITRQEQSLAYSSSKSPLNSKNIYWGLSPLSYFNTAYGHSVYSNGYHYSNLVETFYGVRPSISLRIGIQYISGDGSSDIPYIIDMDS